MMSTGYLLLLSLCCWFVGATNPGLKIRLSQPGLNYAATVAVQELSAKVQGASLLDQSGRAHTPVGKVDYEVKNMRVASFQQPSTSVAVNAGRGLTWSLSGAAISVHGDWGYKYKKFFITISDHDSFDASASGMSISVSVTLGATAAGEPTIRATGCTCHIDRVRIRLHGGASWLYNLFMGFVERPLRDNLQRKICEAAQTAINTDAARELATLPVKVPIGHDKQWLLDYRLVSSPTFASGYLESFHKSEFFKAGDSTEAPFQPSPLPSPPTVDRMVTFLASSYVLNTAGFVLHKRNMLRYYLTKQDLPEAFRPRLNTTCSFFLDGCIGALVPAVGRNFPDASVEIEMYSSASPVARINSQNLIGNFLGVSVLRARLFDGSLAHLFTMNVTAEIKVAPRLDGTVLKAKVLSMENTFTVVDSSVGEISTALVGLAFNVIKESFIIPKLNEVGEMGFPLPTIKHVRFINTGLQLENECLRVFTDVTYSPNVLYFHP